MIYFDNAATTKIHKEVLASMLPYMDENYGNPNGKYYSLAENAKNAVLNSRRVIAAFFNCEYDEIIFTSGASESNNQVIKSIFFSNIKNNPHFITTSIEHSSVIEAFKFIEKLGAEVTYLDVDETGMINVDQLKNEIKSTTKLISVGYVNGEIGTIQNIENINKIVLENNIELHIDATQAILHKRIDLNILTGITYLSMSAHKVYGPKGIGVLYIRKDNDGVKRNLLSLISGGDQEYGYRSGTTPVFLVVGMSKAIEILNNNFDAFNIKINDLEDLLITEIIKLNNPNITINNINFNKIKGIISLRVKDMNNQLLLKKAANLFAASTGSACSNTKPSYVLEALNYSVDKIRETIRISIGIFNESQEIMEFIEYLK